MDGVLTVISETDDPYRGGWDRMEHSATQVLTRGANNGTEFGFAHQRFLIFLVYFALYVLQRVEPPRTTKDIVSFSVPERIRRPRLMVCSCVNVERE